MKKLIKLTIAAAMLAVVSTATTALAAEADQPITFFNGTFNSWTNGVELTQNFDQRELFDAALQAAGIQVQNITQIPTIVPAQVQMPQSSTPTLTFDISALQQTIQQRIAEALGQ